jgi:hypothetical protein
MIRHVRTNAIGYIALFVALGGTATAATLAVNSVGTAQIKNSAVTSAKVKNGSLTATDFKAGQLPRGATGAKGDTGATGPAGPAGAPATSMWAVVRPDGTLVRGSGVQTTIRNNVGLYGVAFTRSIVNCAQVVSIGGYTIGAESNVPPPGQIQSWVSATGPEVAERTLNVGTQTSSGTVEDRAFHVVVSC